MTQNTDAFIQLDRTFHELSEHAGQSDDVDLSQVFHVDSKLRWVDILKQPRTVILSEAGSGKTEEIKNATIALKREGKVAFFARLEFLAGDFDSAFEIGSASEFDAWLSSDEPGWILLDSVDEARLGSPKDFERAIRRIGAALKNARDRAIIVLTGRTHAWRAKTDLDLCERHIGAPPQFRVLTSEHTAETIEGSDEPSEAAVETEDRASSKGTRFRIVALDDLSREQVAIFAKAKGVADVGAFLDDIDRSDAWASTARPQDLEDVIALWMDKARIGTRLEVMQNSIDRRLMERDQERAVRQPLSDEKVRYGAMLLAASATLSQSQIIRVPDGADNTKGISPKAALPDWTDAEISALLSRPIFDGAIYGTVRFHHRSVREYLTALWLKTLLERLASRRAIEDLLFKRQYGLEVIVPTMRPILPWLAIFDERIRERVRRIASEVIFEGGDPAALPLPVRKEILGEVCGKLARSTLGRSATEYSAVQRFAHPDIADQIGLLLKQYASNDEVVSFLIRMIWLGKLNTLLPAAKSVALSRKTRRYTRIAAIRAVRAVGSDVDNEDIRQSFLKESPRHDRELSGELMSDLRPTDAAITWVLEICEHSEVKERYAIDRLGEALSAFTQAVELRQLPVLLAGLTRLLNTPPFVDRGYCEVSARFSWIMKSAVEAAERLIEARDPSALHTDCLDVLHRFNLVRRWGEEERNIKAELESLIPPWRELNDAAFWYDVSTTRGVIGRKGKGRLTDYWRAQIFGSFWRFSADDFERVVGWIGSRSEEGDKLVALSLAFAIFAENGRRNAWRSQLKTACSGNSELADRLKQLLNPPAEATEHKRQEQKWKRQSTRREKKQAAQLEKDTRFVREHLELARNPDFPDLTDISRVQWFLHGKIQEKREDKGKWTGGRWTDLIPGFGKEVAEAYRDGARAYWRRYRPQLRSEGAEPNQTPMKVIFGLAGLEIESGDEAWVSGLSDEDVELATRYALHELNGFPNWFPGLYAERSSIPATIFLHEIKRELVTGKRGEANHYVLSDISWSAEWAWADLAPQLFLMLKTKEPENDSHLHQLLKIVQGSEIRDADIAELAAVKVQQPEADHHAADWFAVWVGVDPDVAVPALLKRLDSQSDDNARTVFAMQFITKLWGGRRSEMFGARGRFLTPKHLTDLHIAMHRHIRMVDDIRREKSGVYSPELRDDAQSARDRILGELIKISGKEAFLALQAIAESQRQASNYPHLTTLYRNKAEADADLKPWTPANVQEFHSRQDRTPTTHRELADLAVLRLLDLKDDLEEGDDSVAAVVHQITDETLLRNFIGHDLRQRAFGRYSIPSEEEMADAKRPDLRFHHAAIDAPVPVELKIADKWSGPALLERLENQLAGDYLRDVRTGRGVFLLVNRGVERSTWTIPGLRRRVDFQGLVEALNAHWKSLAARYPSVDDITVIGIDLTRRAQ